MGTEVLRPQDCLIRVPPAGFSRRRSYGNCYNYGNYGNNFNGVVVGSGKIHRKPVARPEQRKRVASSERRPSSDDSKVARGSGLVMEKVTILRRGQSLDSKMKIESLKKVGDNFVVVGTQRIGPDPEMVPKQIRIMDLKHDVYAGSAFSMSPSPSALPFPSFQRKQMLAPATVVVDNSATRDLRRLLRLD